MAVQTSEAIEGAPADQRRPAVRGHALALVTVVVWAVTFVSTKVLLVHLAPIEILFFRFVIGFVALALLRPRILHVRGFKEERWFMLAGATGVTVYYLLENIALTFTTASIVGVVEVVREAYPDHTAQDPENNHFDPRATPEKPIWEMVDVRLHKALPALSRKELSAHAALAGMELMRRGSRLSVQPVSAEAFEYIMHLANEKK